MAEVDANVREAFRAVNRDTRATLHLIRESVNQAESTETQWPELKDQITETVMPTFSGWIQQLKDVIQPKQMKTLQKHKRGLERMVGRTWWHPRGLALRLRVMGYGVLMGLAILLLLVLGIGAVVGVVYLVSLFLNRG